MIWLRKTMRQLFPPPRRPVSRAATIPLILFLVLFIGVCVTVVMLQKAEFSRPWVFILSVVTPWIWWMHAAGYSTAAVRPNTTSPA